MPNRLIEETSPYLLQHAENPVNWLPWGPAALEEAQTLDRPIFLSIGYSACHWCHVMARESFENPVVAELLNNNFISIKVDREERPDVDAIYMDAVINLTGSGGWPMSVFLLPDGKPFYGGTYYPPVRKYGMPSFTDLLLGIISVWQNDRQNVLKAAHQLFTSINYHSSSKTTNNINPDDQRMEQASKKLTSTYDWVHGGWGTAPKFPLATPIDFLITRALEGDQHASDVVDHMLITIQSGGIHDHLGGGFHRYSTDENWRIPHFEKMIYDNAQLSLSYLHAYLINKKQEFKDTCFKTLNFIQEELSQPEGGFYSSLNAESEGIEGKYYTWDYEDIRSLVNKEDFEFIKDQFNLSENGIYEGKNILYLTPTNSPNQLKVPPQYNASDKLRSASIQKHLLEHRSKRVRPTTDTKIVVFWNALTIQAFAEAARHLNNNEYYVTAKKAAVFILNNCIDKEVLYRSWREKRSTIPAFLEDYAALILALLSLYQIDFDPFWYAHAVRLNSALATKFTDPFFGFFDTPSDEGTLIYRPKNLADQVTPSGNALALRSLIQLLDLTYDSNFQEQAERTIRSMGEIAFANPHSHAYWLQTMDLFSRPRHQVAILWSKNSKNNLTKFLEIINHHYLPGLTLAGKDIDDSTFIPFLENKPLINGQTTAYPCKGRYCEAPVTDPIALSKYLLTGAQKNPLST